MANDVERHYYYLLKQYSRFYFYTSTTVCGLLYVLGVVKSAALTSYEGGVVLHRVEVAILTL